MELRPLKTKRDYHAALKEVENLWNAPARSKAADRLEVLVLLIQAYEAIHYAIPDPDPIDFLHQVMESRELTRKDLEPLLDPAARIVLRQHIVTVWFGSLRIPIEVVSK
jgi:HTH-type transcriptional regulator / antitoxin HigA